MRFGPVFSSCYQATISCLIAILFLTIPAKASELDILKGETIRVIIGASAGGTTDTTARSFFDYLDKILPDTTIRIQNIRGSGGAKAVKELQEADGNLITVATFGYSPIYGQLISPEMSPYDLTRVHWVGSLTKKQRVLAMQSGLGGTTLATLPGLDRQAISATSDALSSTTIETLLLNAMIGLRMKVVRGTSDSQQAAMLLSGDIDAILGDPFEFDQQFKSGQLIPVLRFSTDTVSPSLEGVPAISDVVPADVPRELVFLMETLDKTGRLLAAAPSTEPKIVDALRAAFGMIAHDQSYIEEMARVGIAVAPTSGVELTERLEKVLGASSAPLNEALKFYLACGERMSEERAISCN